jgi:2-polyprenyl-3-methyl-5-hydroxy-6-metoxy-1,4-benzoquinol methylase
MEAFESVEFWNQRYEKQYGITFDWLESYKQLRILLLKDCLAIYPDLTLCQSERHQQNLIYDETASIEVLDVGCGNSSLAEQMYDHDKFTKITCID